MIYMLIEVRGIVKPLLTQVKSISIDEFFLEAMDVETEMIVRMENETIEIYNQEAKIWEPIPTV